MKRAFASIIMILALLLGVAAPGAECVIAAAAASSAYSIAEEPVLIENPFISKDDPAFKDVLDRLDKEKLDFVEIGNRPVFPFRPGDTEEEPEVYDLPSEYCLRDDYVVYTQTQDKHGYCWNFAATMAASTTLMKATNEYYDLSELWTGVGCHKSGLQSKIGAGGVFSYHYRAMQKHGLMLESDLPYQESYTVSDENAGYYYDFYNQYSNNDLAGCLLHDNTTSFKRTEVDKIKNHIYNHGSVYMAFYFKTGFIERDGVHSLDPNQKNTNSMHAVSVIGWDDNYEMDFYLDGSDTPTTFKGAWIIMNSYTETSGTDGISLIFYDDTNIANNIEGYKYVKDTEKDLYFYDKIESGYSYPIRVNGKYCADFTAQDGLTKQQNIFRDDVALTYSYEISSGARITGIEIYLGNKDVTDDFDIRIEEESKRFYISRPSADYGNYKVLVRYGNGSESGTYLNNFYVTYGLAGEELEFDSEKNAFAFNNGKDLEYFSYIVSDKNYVIYTDKLSGSVFFNPIEQSVYSDKNMSIPELRYEITDGKNCVVTHTVAADDGNEIAYNFIFVYCSDTSLQPVKVYYDLGGGTNHGENYRVELANQSTGLMLYTPVREGYTFVGWQIENTGDRKLAAQNGNVHTVVWEDIHHMGESPTLHASAYYKQYYNNSNVLFVSAVWEKTEYTVSWSNWDGTLITEETYHHAETPCYLPADGNYPTRPADDRYTYTFAGWDTAISPVTADATYTALFIATPIDDVFALYDRAERVIGGLTVAMVAVSVLAAASASVAATFIIRRRKTRLAADPMSEPTSETDNKNME